MDQLSIDGFEILLAIFLTAVSGITIRIMLILVKQKWVTTFKQQQVFRRVPATVLAQYSGVRTYIPKHFQSCVVDNATLITLNSADS